MILKRYKIYFLALGVCILFTGCKKWLDINSDPDTTQEPSNSSVLPQILAAIPTALESDGGLYVSKYIQNWLTHTSANQNTYDNQGYTFAGGTMAATWNMVYYAHGKNLQYLLENADKRKQNDFLGVGLAIKAWDFQHGTDYHSDMPFYDALKDQFSFHYDSQDTIYKCVDSLCRRAIIYLNAAIGNPSNTVGKGDMVYSGDLVKWKKFVFGILARNYNHLSNKSFYQPDSVVKYCDSSMQNAVDDFFVPFDATFNDNSNYFGPYRDNMPSLRQSNFIVHLLDGSTLTGSSAPANRDPRISHMLSASYDTTNGNGGYRGVDPGAGDPYSALGDPKSYYVNGAPPTSGANLTNYKNARLKVGIAYGDSLVANPSKGSFGSQGKYLFKNKAAFPVMTASEIQFIKAEAAFRMGNKAMAMAAYKKGIQLHFDFINRDYSLIRGSYSLYNINPISTSAMTTYLNGPNVRNNPDSLSLSDIMLQKYIALWGWGFIETWVDLRRFNLYDAAGFNDFLLVYKGFSPVIQFPLDNGSKYAQKVRPHYTSEFTYNLSELKRLGITNTDWHVTKMWFSIP